MSNDPLITADELRLHMGELTADEVRIAQAAYRLGAARVQAERDAALARAEADAARLDYIERTFSGMTNRERYLPVQMIWGKGCNGRTLRAACDKYMKRDTTLASGQGDGHRVE